MSLLMIYIQLTLHK